MSAPRRHKVGGRKVRVAPLAWKQEGYLHFAHAKEGMYILEQRRGKFIATLDLAGAHRGGAEQIMGTYPSSAKAKAALEKDHRAMNKLNLE
jgi:hypothetical protein